MVPRGWKTFSYVLLVLLTIVAPVALWHTVIEKGMRPLNFSNAYDVLSRQKAAWNRGDLDGFMAEYQMTDDTTMFSGPNVRQGWTAIMDNYRIKYQGNGKSMGQLAFNDVVVEFIGPGVAIARGKWHVVKSDGESGGLFTLILKRIDGEWKIVHDHTS